MNKNEVYNFMINVNNKESLMITFDDRDEYRLSNLRFYAYGGYQGEPIYEMITAKFKDCLNCSNTFRKALRLGNGNGRLSSVHWSSEENEPQKVTYDSEDVIAIFNQDKQYFVYQKIE